MILTKKVKFYLNIGILVKESDKSLHKIEKEINTAKQTLVAADL